MTFRVRSAAMARQRTFRTGGLALLAAALSTVCTAQTPDQIQGLKWRNIGPFRGGRVSAVSGAIGQQGTFYIGMPQGGVFKTTGAGQTWYPVADSIKDVSSFGSVQVAPSDPNTVYAGTGEAIGSEGNGVYKSTDAGKTWQHLGLEESQMIPALLVDPKDPNLVLLAAEGNERMRTKQRGVMRSTDGGKTWTTPLFIDEETGVQHIAWAYDNPSVVFGLSVKHFNGKPSKASGTPMLYKSSDEGQTWTKLTPKGLPLLTGRMCLAVAQNTKSQRVFLIGTFGLYRSDDGGANWTQMAVGDDRIANGQGNYTSGVYVDSQNPDIVYTLATCVYRSLDGGKTFTGLKGAPGGDDPQQLWIDPTDGNRMLLGGDQGATVTHDGGKTWGLWYNQPTAQVYHISTDNRWPYSVYATQQDSGVVATKSRGNLGAISSIDWYPHAGFEFGTIVVDPLNPDVSYCLGPNLSILKVTYRSGQWIECGPDLDPSSGLHLGFDSPMAFSPFNKHELMIGFNKLMATTDGGVHWKAISPDLSVAKGAKPGAPAAFMGSAIASFSPSTIDNGIIWAAASNALVHVTKDHGATWTDVSIPNLKRASISCIDASHTDPATAYVALRYGGNDDSRPHYFRTRDFGKTWREISSGLPTDRADGFAHFIRADSKRDGLLFAGTENGIYVSFNDGDSWQSLLLNMPTTSFRDLQIHGNDLVLGTYGRGLWILDDYTPLREVSTATLAEAAHLYKPGEAVRVRRNVNLDTPFPPEVPHAANPPLGAVIYYSLASKPTGDVKIEISDSHGKVVRHLASAAIIPYDDPETAIPNWWIEERKPLTTEIGLNRINWNIRYDTPPAFTHDPQDTMGGMVKDTPQATEGPLALPGEYTVKLIVDGKEFTQKLIVKNDPRSPASAADLRAQNQLLQSYYAQSIEAHEAYQQVMKMRQSVTPLLEANPSEEVTKALKDFDKKLGQLGGTVKRGRRFFGPPPATSFVNINGFMLSQMDGQDMGDMAPTESMLMAHGAAWSKLNVLVEKWKGLNSKDLVELNKLLTKNGLPSIPASVPLAEVPAPPARYLPKVDPKKPTTGRGNIDPEELERQAHGGRPDDQDDND